MSSVPIQRKEVRPQGLSKQLVEVARFNSGAGRTPSPDMSRWRRRMYLQQEQKENQKLLAEVMRERDFYGITADGKRRFDMRQCCSAFTAKVKRVQE